MRCAICNAVLGEKEIKFNTDHQEFDPCSTCLDAIAEVFEDPLEEDEYRDDYFEEGSYDPFEDFT